MHQQVNMSSNVQEKERQNNTLFVLLKIVLGLLVYTEGAWGGVVVKALRY